MHKAIPSWAQCSDCTRVHWSISWSNHLRPGLLHAPKSAWLSHADVLADFTGAVCPDDYEMCVNPGYLTCRATLNDCSGRGDCLQGACFCHNGWGGDDCSVPICINNCPDVRPASYTLPQAVVPVPS